MSVNVQGLPIVHFALGCGYWLALSISAACLAIQIVLSALRCIMARIEAAPARASTVPVRPVFSVHLAIHGEPPGVVIGTLRALSAQDWPAARYDVIVIDNNTADPALWHPVAAACADLGARFRFLHRMNVTGAKAGALNIALSQTRSDATHIVTVDADYVTDPGFLSLAARALNDTGADYVQFPQAYAGCERSAAGVDAELEDYFHGTARMADVADAVLLTGTLCVISAPALRSAGGWSGRTITEDAELGVRLCRSGFHGRFIDRIVGRGVLPFSLPDLERQRHRWAGGNLQTLLAHAPSILWGRNGMGLRRRGAILSQLTAWLNLSLLPAAILLASLMAGPRDTLLTTLAAASVVLAFAEILVRLAWRGRHDRSRPTVVAAAICTRLALAPASACATLAVLLGRTPSFAVTDKSAVAPGRDATPSPAGVVLFVAAAIALPAGLAAGWLVTLAVLALLTPFPAAVATARSLERYRLHVAPSPIGA